MAVCTLLVLILCREIAMAAAQPGGGGSRSDPYLAGRVTPSMAIIIIVLITAVFFMAFFSIYIRHCSDGNAGGSMRAMVAAVAGRSTRRRGLDPDKLHALPTFVYSEVKGLKIGKGALECAVCLNEFEESETLRFIPQCDHVFHSDCIDVWLGSNTTCPVCRADLDSPDPVQPEFGSEPGSTDPTAEIQPEEQFRPVRSWSRKLSFARLPKSHSTGHSLVQPGQDCERFTLVLPDEARKRLLNRGLVVLSRESSSRRGYRTAGEGSSGRNYRRIDRLEPGVKSDRWVFTKAPPFFARATSFKAPLNCLSPKNSGSDSLPSDSAPFPI